jgi:hypothetical protein
MNKLLLRVTVVLLIPCLIADPALASRVSSMERTRTIHAHSSALFSQQAVVAALANILQDIEKPPHATLEGRRGFGATQQRSAWAGLRRVSISGAIVVSMVLPVDGADRWLRGFTLTQRMASSGSRGGGHKKKPDARYRRDRQFEADEERDRALDQKLRGMRGLTFDDNEQARPEGKQGDATVRSGRNIKLRHVEPLGAMVILGIFGKMFSSFLGLRSSRRSRFLVTLFQLGLLGIYASRYLHTPLVYWMMGIEGLLAFAFIFASVLYWKSRKEDTPALVPIAVSWTRPHCSRCSPESNQ